MNTTWKAAAVGAALTALVAGAPAAAQSFEDVPGLTHYGDADGWQVKKIDSDDIWMGQACILMRDLTPGPNPVQAIYRFEPGEDEIALRFRVPKAEEVGDPDSYDWGKLEPMTFQYAVSGDRVFEVEGDLGFEYIDSRTVYVEFWLELDATAVDRIAAAELVALGANDEGIATFTTGRATRAVSLARRCLRSF